MNFLLFYGKRLKQGLSAGRVQSVAVRLIVEREKEIANFITKVSYKIVALFLNQKEEFIKAELSTRFTTMKKHIILFPIVLMQNFRLIQ